MRLDIYGNPNTKDILDAIGLDEDKIPRVRGVGIDGGKILIHTRTGGGNREEYDSVDSYINGEYGLNSSIENYKKPADWLKDVPEDERKEHIAKLEADKKEVLETSAHTNDYMRNNPYFISDNDEEFDSTYADWWFVIPKEHAEKLLPLEDPIRKAALGNTSDYIAAVIGGDDNAKQRILERIESANQSKDTTND